MDRCTGSAARSAYTELLRRAPHEGLPERRRVPCSRMRQLLAQHAAERTAANAEPPLPPASLCRPIVSAGAIQRARASFHARGYAELPPLLDRHALAYAVHHYEALARSSHGGFYRDEPNPNDREYDSIVGAPATVALCYSEHPRVKGASDPTPNRFDPAGSRWILHPAAQDG